MKSIALTATIFLIATFGLTGLAEAQAASQSQVFETGNDLWSWCGETTSGTIPQLCGGYVAGVIDAFQEAGATRGFGICIPSGSQAQSLESLINVVRKFLNENPTTRTYSAASEVGVALKTAFPCSGS